jgi:hypothetical protein
MTITSGRLFGTMRPTRFGWRSFRSGFAACAHRIALCKTLHERGGFTHHEAFAAFYGVRSIKADGNAVLCSGDVRSEIERRIATWLMGELEKLPKRKTTTEESSPVRRRGLMSKLEIADIAIALLDYSHFYDLARGWGVSETETPPVVLHPPTPELIQLLGNLLDVTRHREAFDYNKRHKNQSLAIYYDAMATRLGKTLTGKKLAKLANVSTYSISIWRRSKEYQERVAFQVKADKPFPRPPGALSLREQDL